MTHTHAKSAGWPEVREMESNLEFIYVRDDGSERNAVRQNMNWWPRHKNPKVQTIRTRHDESWPGGGPGTVKLQCPFCLTVPVLGFHRIYCNIAPNSWKFATATLGN